VEEKETRATFLSVYMKVDAFVFTNSNVGISFYIKVVLARPSFFCCSAQESRLSAAAEAFSYLIDAARALFLYEQSIQRHAHLFSQAWLGRGAHMKY
jgi:hypothetical protein